MFHLTGLDIHQREDQGVAVLELHGKLHMGSGDVALREFAESLLAQSQRQVVLDLTKVSDIDSAGAESLLILAQKYLAAGGRLVLFGLNRAHAKIYEAARLESSVDSYSSEVDAVNSFFPDRAAPHYDILQYVECHAHEDHTDEEKDHKSQG